MMNKIRLIKEEQQALSPKQNKQAHMHIHRVTNLAVGVEIMQKRKKTASVSTAPGSQICHLDILELILF